MRGIKWACSFIIGIGFLVCLTCHVQGSDDGHLLGMGMGFVGVIDDHKVAFGSIEYRPPVELFNIKPWVNVYFGDDLFYGATGFLMDFKISENLIFTPSLGLGMYTEEKEVDLGHELEFQSAAEISYRFKNSGRLGFSFGHISNNSIGDMNPGTELIKITYFIPLGFK
jgi:hypothetical protein